MWRTDQRVRRERKPARRSGQSRRLRLNPLEPRLLLDAGPIISEFMASNIGGLLDEDGDSSDWIEIYNPTPDDVDLTGWYLTDEAGNLDKWPLPAVSLEPSEFLVVFASDKDRTDPAGNLHTNFKLGADGEYLALVMPDGSTVAHEYAPEFPEQLEGVSYGIGGTIVVGDTLVGEAASFRVLVPEDDSLGTSWTDTTLDDSAWTLGSGGVGYDTRIGQPPPEMTYEGLIETDLAAEMWGRGASVYVRTTFEVMDPAGLESLELRMKYDDGFVAYLNGVEIARRHAPSSPAFDSTATAEHPDEEAIQFEAIDVSEHLGLLSPGANVLSIHGLNVAPDDSDFLLVPELTGLRRLSESAQYFAAPTPGSENVPGTLGFVADVTFSVERGFYDAPFYVEISTDTPDAEIRYTTDGALPTATTGHVYSMPIYVETTTTLRAAAFKPGYLPTDVDAHTCLFLEDVIRQDGQGWPDNWGHDGADYAMDPDVVDDPAYRDTIIDDLKSIPSVSIAMERDDLFGPDGQGIYREGTGSERAASIELIQPDGSDGFQINAAVQIQGGSSTSRWKVDKLSLRVKFKEPYGPTKLEAPLFEGSAVDCFDTIILDSMMNLSWLHADDWQRTMAQYVRDQYVADIQNAMGGYAPHGFYVHLYLDGLYWGLYWLHERPDESFAASYTGGDKDDYDVIKHNPGTIVNGTNANYNEMRAVAEGDLSDPAQYDLLKEYLDVPNLIDYVITNFYVGNTDWAHHNWYASRNRVDPDGRWRFHTWDAEHVLKNLNDDVTGKSDTGSPTWFHQQLTANAEYVTAFADRVQELFFHDGLLTAENAAAMYNARLDEVDRAVVGESARWGDNRRPDDPYTRDDEWAAERDRLLNDYFPQRTDVVLAQIRAQGLYPAVEPPQFSRRDEYVDPGSTLLISNPNAAGTVYYTLDGSDPRLAGGDVSPSAQAVQTSTTTTLLVPAGSAWAYLDDGSDQGAAWRLPAFDDGAWASGPAELGYGDGDEQTVVGYGTDPNNKFTTTYFRHAFSVTGADQLTALELRLLRDDGAVVYLNGQEAARSNMPAGAVDYRTFASGSVTGSEETTIRTILLDPALLVEGDNVLAVEIHQNSLTSSDLGFDAALEASTTVVTPIVLNEGATVRARVLSGGQWSAIDSPGVFVGEPATVDNLAVSELNYHPHDPDESELLVDPGFTSSDFEFIELVNAGPERIDLSSIAFVKGIQFRFSGSEVTSLDPGERVLVAANREAFEARYGASAALAGEFVGGLDDGGERVTLADALGQSIADFAYSDAGDWPGRADGKGSSLEAIYLAGNLNDPHHWRSSSEYGGSPGAAGLEAYTDVVVNEVFTNPGPSGVGWIELLNTSDQPVDVSGWYLSDSIVDWGKFAIPPGSVLSSGEYAVFDESDFNASGGADPRDFALNPSGGDVWLLQPVAAGSAVRLADLAELGAAAEGVALGRWPDGRGDFVPAELPSPGAQNTGTVRGPLVISEFMAVNDSALADEDGEFSDWIEIYNPTPDDVDLAGWHLTDSDANLAKWQFPSVTLDAGGYLVVFASGKDRAIAGSELHTDFKLSGDGEPLALVKPDGVTISHRYTPAYPPQEPNVSYGLSSDLSTEGYFTLPTPGSPNAGEPISDPTRQILITEIMYHPLSENSLEEYIELHNRGISPVNLAGWSLSAGVDFTFPDVTLEAGEYLVVAADLPTFSGLYPGVSNVVGPWTGQLGDRSETIQLVDAGGNRIDRVLYADQGDWAVRERGPLDHGHEGWIWTADHDAGGKSLELVSSLMPNEYGQNWSGSIPDGGTPGAANSVAATDIPPIILDVTHGPVIPRSTDPVTITARAMDELATGVTMAVYYRDDGAASFSTLAMLDDGLHGDGGAGDEVYGAVLPARPDGTVVEFYVQATDVGSNVRTWPAPAQPADEPLANVLYQVDDTFDPDAAWVPGSQPIYYIVMTEAERAELADIGDGGDGEQDSDAQMNATFISLDGVDTQVRYNVGVRNRGHGSRDDPPNNYRVDFVHDRPWEGITRINLNSKYTYSQVIGSALFLLAGIPAAEAKPVQVRVNGQDLAETALRMYGSYVAVEVPDHDFTQRQFPDDPDGNVYTALRSDFTPEEADLRYEGPDPDSYRDTYYKDTNEEIDDWSDLIHMTDVLNNAPDETYLEEVSQVIDVDEWMRYLALDSLLLNRETGLNRGTGDDYAMYRGDVDTRFLLVPHDLDTLINLGNNTAPTDYGIFEFTYVAGLNRLLNHPDVAPLYYQALVETIDTLFNLQTLGPLFDQVLGGWVPQARIDEIQQFVTDRTAGVLAQIPREFAVNSDLPVVDGYYRTVQPVADLSGTADAAYTHSVLVNGLPADWDPRAGTWTIGSQTSGEVDALVASGSDWRYLDDGSNQGTAWRENTFGDAAWSSGPAQLGYGDGDEATEIGYGPDAGNRYITTYFRQAFEVADASDYVGLTLRLLRDDGAVIYLNGQEVLRDNMPSGAIGYQTLADTAIGGADESTFWEFAVDPGLLIEGTNVLAVEVHQSSPTSSDVSFDLELEASRPSGATGVPLVPGVNRVRVEALDAAGNLVDEGYVDVWYDAPALGNRQLDMTVRDSFLPGVPLLVQVEVTDALGTVDRELWDAVVTLSVDGAPPTGQVTLYNGRGSALVTVNEPDDFTLIATLGSLETSRTITSLEGAPVTEVSGTLPGTETAFSGVVHVTGDLVVPAGHTLTLQPGTLVLLDGVASGEDGTDVDVLGNIQSLGTAAQPVTFTAFDPDMPWGEIHHDGADPSLYQYTNVTRAGNSPATGHSNSGPALRTADSTITFDHAALTDNAGKVMMADGSDLTFLDSLLARSIMGPEIAGSALWFEDSYVTDMHAADDGDGIYIHAQQAGQVVTITGSVFAVVDDDCIDTLDSDVTIHDVIVRNANDKGISVYNGEVTLDHSLVVDNALAPEDATASSISAKGTSGATVTVHMDHVTLVTDQIGIQGRDKYGVPDVVIEYYVANSIIVAADAVQTDYDPADIHISYSNVSETWPGTGNLDQDPLFVSPGSHDYHLQSGSPSIDAGDPAGPLDPDATRADQGVYQPGEVSQSGSQIVPGGSITEDTLLAFTGGPYRVTGDVTVEPGATLTIELGVTVFFEAGTSLTVKGRLVAEGTEDALIHFTKVPGGGNWEGLQFLNTMADNRIAYAVVEYGVTNNGMIGLDSSNLLVDHVTFDHTDRRRIRSIDSSLIVRNSTFTDVFPGAAAPTTDNLSEHIWGRNIPSGGHFIIQNNVFGVVKGHNDAIDFDAGFRPDDPVPQILDNVFLGSGDDCLDLEGDAHVEGNVFLHVHKDQYNTDPGESNVISAGGGHEFVVVRNVFYDVGHVAIVKDDSFMTFTNNTVVDADLAAIYFDLPGQTNGPGRGAYLDGNVFDGTPVVFAEVLPTTDLTVHRSILPAEYHGYGVGNLGEDPRLADPAGGDVSLRPGSPALGTGPGGLDMGAIVPGGPSICGEPPARTPATDATLTVFGPGLTHYKVRVNDGPWSEERSIHSPIELTGLSDGTYTVSVLGRNSAYAWQDEAQPAVSETWTVDTSSARVRINEVLAVNLAAADHEGTYPDMIELVNDGAIAVDLAGMGISDDDAFPAKFVFPAGTLLAPGDFLVLYADSDTTTSGLHLGFSLDGAGEGVYLVDTAANGQALLDSVQFGVQIPGLSIGRTGHDGTWTLTQPTFGAANVAVRTGDPTALWINEWFADGDVRLTGDFVELYNPDPLPVPLAGLYLTDNPVSQPAKYEIPPLSFIAGGGFAAFQADDDPAAGAAHLNFKLSADQELLALLDRDGGLIDRVIYYPQTTDFSQGRNPDGGPQYAFFRLPTPGTSNGAASTTTVEAIAINDVWAYDQSGADLGAAWCDPAYDDSLWPAGPGVLGVEDDPIPAAINTDLTLGPMTYYFRKHFTVDADPAGVSLDLTMLVDDGAVVYLNGAEVLRVGMPAGAVDYDTAADRTVGDADWEGPFTIPAAFLVRGDNVLAVEVHQINSGSSDIVFGLALNATATVYNEPVEKALALLDGLRVTELMYNPVGGSDFEFVELTNVGTAALDLTGVRLRGGIDFTFPEMMLRAGERVVVAGDLEMFQRRYGPGVNVAGEFSGNLGDGGDQLVVQLPDPLPAAVLRFDYDDAWYATTDGGGHALVVRDAMTDPARWNEADSWQAGSDVGGSPGTDDGGTIQPGVVINEVLIHTDLPQVDSIELANLTTQPIDIGGWYLSDSTGRFLKFRIPDGTVLAPGTYAVFDEDDFNTSAGADPNDFALDGAHGDDVWLVETDATGNVVRVADYAVFGAAANGVSFGRWPEGVGELAPLKRVTLGAENSQPRVHPLVISELMYNPPDPGDGTDPSDLEFIEIYNPTPETVDLAGWELAGGVDFAFAPGTALDSEAVVVVVSFDPADPANSQLLATFCSLYGIGAEVALVGGYSGSLDNGGETVRLMRPDEPPADEPDFVPMILVDEVDYDDVAPWPAGADGGGQSLVRVAAREWGNDPGSWSCAAPDPGACDLGPLVTLDQDGDGRADPLTDGALVVRYLEGLSGGELIAGVLGPEATRTDPAEVSDYLDDGWINVFDVDANGRAEASTDGMLILRYLFGFTGDALVAGVIDPEGFRTDASEIEAFLDYFNVAGAPAVGDNLQIVTASPAGQTTSPGEAVAVDVFYTSDAVDETLVGLGLRIHFDSTKLELEDLVDVLGTGLVTLQDPQPDTADDDGDPSTDVFATVAWADPIGSQWPGEGALPAKLLTVNFTAAASLDDGSTWVHLSSSSTSPGYALSASSAEISGAPLAELSITDVALAEGDSGATDFVFTVSLSQSSDTEVTVEYATVDGTATAGSDYTAAGGQLTFAPGQTERTVTVAVVGDATIEPDETFTIELSQASGATIADFEGVGTIQNDDGLWQSPSHPLDVNRDYYITVQDALIVANFLHYYGQQPVPEGPGTPPFPVAPPPYYDVSGDDYVTVQDALLVANYLHYNGQGPVPEGSGSPSPPAELPSDDECSGGDPVATQDTASAAITSPAARIDSVVPAERGSRSLSREVQPTPSAARPAAPSALQIASAALFAEEAASTTWASVGRKDVNRGVPAVVPVAAGGVAGYSPAEPTAASAKRVALAASAVDQIMADPLATDDIDSVDWDLVKSGFSSSRRGSAWEVLDELFF